MLDLIFTHGPQQSSDLVKIAPHDSSADIHLFVDFVMWRKRDVPGPYYGDMQDFESVYSMLATGWARLLATLFQVSPIKQARPALGLQGC